MLGNLSKQSLQLVRKLYVVAYLFIWVSCVFPNSSIHPSIHPVIYPFIFQTHFFNENYMSGWALGPGDTEVIMFTAASPVQRPVDLNTYYLAPYRKGLLAPHSADFSISFKNELKCLLQEAILPVISQAVFKVFTMCSSSPIFL